MTTTQEEDSLSRTSKSEMRTFMDELADQLKSLTTAVARIDREKSPSRRSELLSALASHLRDVGNASEGANRLSELISHEASLVFLQLEAAIRELCEKNGWRLDGHWPDFIVDLAVPVHIDDKARVIRIHGKSHGVDELEDAIGGAVREALPKRFSPAEFMKTVLTAYGKLSTAEQTQIAIHDLYQQIVIDMQTPRFWRDASASSFTPFSVDRFRATFSRMLEAGVTGTPDGCELKLIPPLNPKDGVFIYQPAERRFGFVGRVEFVRP